MQRKILPTLISGLLALLCLASLVVSPAARAASGEQPARTPVFGTATALAGQPVAPPDEDPETAPITLRAPFAPATAWSVVQWQDGHGGWHNVEGWRGALEDGQKTWWVLERNFGQGPFRWVVYDPKTGQVWARSASFSLPAEGDQALEVPIPAVAR